MSGVVNKINYAEQYRRFRMKYRSLSKDAIGYQPNAIDEIVIYLKNGNKIFYNFVRDKMNVVEREYQLDNKLVRRGRPRIEKPRSERIEMRITEDQKLKLKQIKFETGKSASDLLREVIDNYRGPRDDYYEDEYYYEEGPRLDENGDVMDDDEYNDMYY